MTDDELWKKTLRLVNTFKLTRERVRDLETIVQSWHASHWRDDDSLQAETGYGVC